jgi:hypothetical protein
MGAAELRVVNGQGSFEQGLGLDQVSRHVATIGQVAENGGHVQVLGPPCSLLNGQGTFQHAFGPAMVALLTTPMIS